MNGCDSPTSSNIPIEVPGDITNYQSNLYAINSGQHLEEVTINWNTYTEVGFVQYIIRNNLNEVLYVTEDINESIYTLNSNPAQFQKLFLVVVQVFMEIPNFYLSQKNIRLNQPILMQTLKNLLKR